jgi:hypothetical protein
MDSFSHFLDLIAQAKTPLAVGGLIAAALVGLLWQIAKNSSIDKDTLKLIVIGAFGLAGLVIILGFIGFMLPPPGPQPQPNPPPPQPVAKNVVVLGTVFGDSADTVGVGQASVTVAPLFDFPLRKVAADANGSFQTEFDDVKGPTPVRIWASASGYKNSPPQTIILDPSAPHAEQRLITLVSADVPTASAQTPQVSLVSVPASNGTAPTTPPPTSWNDVLVASRGNELKLANAASDAFSQGNYKITAQFLTQAKSVSASGLWKSSYPKLAASYYLQGDSANGSKTLGTMVADAKDDIAHGGYFSTPATLDLLAQDLKDARAAVPAAAQTDFDSAIVQINQLRASLNPKDSRPNIKLRALFSKQLKAGIH